MKIQKHIKGIIKNKIEFYLVLKYIYDLSYLTDPADLQPLSTDPDSLQFYKSISSNIPEMNNGGFTLNNENVENNPINDDQSNSDNPNVPNIFE